MEKTMMLMTRRLLLTGECGGLTKARQKEPSVSLETHTRRQHTKHKCMSQTWMTH